MEPNLPVFKDILNNLSTDDGYILVLQSFVVFNVFLFSACWACSINEKREYSPAKGFILGLFLPVVYPIYSYLLLKPASTAKAEEAERKEKEANQDVLADEEIFGDSDLDIGPSYFRKIYRDETGSPTGPFTIELDSNMIIAETIAEVLEDFIVIVSKTPDGGTQRLRIPYSEIQNCTKD